VAVDALAHDVPPAFIRMGTGGVNHGRAVQLDPIKPTLKAPGIKLLKLKYDKQLSNVAFKFNLRRCTTGTARRLRTSPSGRTAARS
jgi:hypothetical protein